MRIFRIMLWTGVIVIIGLLGLTSFQWQRNLTGSEQAYGTNFTLIDQKGNAITQAALREKPAALFFGFTHCPDICPTTLYEMDGWLAQADPSGDNINAFFVTVDPERDTADILDLYVGNVSDRITAITGDSAAVTNMLKGYNVYSKKVLYDENDPSLGYNMDHTASVFLLKEGGFFKGTISYGESADTAVQKLKNLM